MADAGEAPEPTVAAESLAPVDCVLFKNEGLGCLEQLWLRKCRTYISGVMVLTEKGNISDLSLDDALIERIREKIESVSRSLGIRGCQFDFRPNQIHSHLDESYNLVDFTINFTADSAENVYDIVTRIPELAGNTPRFKEILNKHYQEL